MRIAKYVRMSLILAFAAALLAGCNSDDNVSEAPPTHKCADVPVTPVAAGSTYEVPSGASGIADECQVVAALNAGAFVVAYGVEQAFIAESLGGGTTDATGATQLSSNAEPPTVISLPFPDPFPTPVPGPAAPDATQGPVTAFPLSVTAVVRGPDGALVTYTGVADTQALLGADLAAWESSVFSDPASEAKPPPANKVWAHIGSFVASATPTPGRWYPNQPTAGTMGIIYDVYRLATNDRDYDYFMVVTTMSSSPTFVPGVGESCFPTCGYYTYRRSQSINLKDVNSAWADTVDLGPPNAVAVDKVSFSIGGSLSGKIGFGGDKAATGEGNAGINASYSTTFDQPHATTTGLASIGGRTGLWQDDTLNFMSGTGYDWLAWRNITTTAELRNGRAAIFRLPRNAGPTIITPVVESSSLVRASTCNPGLQIINGSFLCFLSVQALYEQIDIRMLQSPSVWLPTFSIDTRTLTIARGDTGTFRIKVRSSWGEAAKSWQIVKDPSDNNLTVTPNSGSDGDPGDLYRTITVKAQPGAVPGTTYTLYVNTVPAGGADSLRNGSLLVTINIQ